LALKEWLEGLLLEASGLGLDGIARFYWVWVCLWKAVIWGRLGN
jgi:hypothetical protein